MNIRDWVAAWWRKTVAVGVGLVLAWLGRRWGIVLDEQSSQLVFGGAVALLASIYGGIVNWAEMHVPALGWFLGLAQQPKYRRRDAVTRAGDGPVL